MIQRTNQRGFTIIELMISTAVFSLVLLVILTAVTQVGRMYYKGITNARTQESARSLLDRISQEIQYSGKSSNPVQGVGSSNGVHILCVGTSRYMYKINQPVDSTNHAVWFDSNGSDVANCTNLAADSISLSIASAPAGGSELLSEGSRLTKMSVTEGSNSLWSVNVMVVYGADDLLDTTDGTSQANSPGLTVCKGSTIGTQFCAVSELSTTVLKRVL